MSDEDDPFEHLGESVEDREGDPFKHLGDAEEQAGEDDEAETGSGRDPRAEPEPGYDAHDVTPADHQDEIDAVEEMAAEATESDDAVVETDEPTVRSGQTGDPDDPFGASGHQRGDPFEDDIFEEMEVGELDPDEVWESLSEAEERGSVTEVEDKRYAEVSKHRFCEQCEFFSDPPDIHCSHDGTEILEFIDQETVRVVDCPIVAEREELERHE